MQSEVMNEVSIKDMEDFEQVFSTYAERSLEREAVEVEMERELEEVRQRFATDLDPLAKECEEMEEALIDYLHKNKGTLFTDKKKSKKLSAGVIGVRKAALTVGVAEGKSEEAVVKYLEGKRRKEWLTYPSPKLDKAAIKKAYEGSEKGDKDRKVMAEAGLNLYTPEDTIQLKINKEGGRRG